MIRDASNPFLQASTAREFYSVDCSQWLGAETRATDLWSASIGIELSNSGFGSNIASILVSGGTIGEKYKIRYDIESSTGRKGSVSFFVEIVSDIFGVDG